MFVLLVGSAALEEKARSAFAGLDVTLTRCETSEEASCYFLTASADCVLLDVIWEGIGAMAMIPMLARAKGRAALIAVTPPNEAFRRRRSLELGADMCLSCDVDDDEFRLASIAAARMSGAHLTDLLQIGDLVLDPLAKAVFHASTQIDLRRREYQVLEMLMKSAGQVISPAQVINRLYGADEAPAEDIVRIFVHGLRHKLAAAGAANDLIETRRGIGYVLSARPAFRVISGAAG
jgi:DNA-binding response OmpR family regulator